MRQIFTSLGENPGLSVVIGFAAMLLFVIFVLARATEKGFSQTTWFWISYLLLVTIFADLTAPLYQLVFYYKFFAFVAAWLIAGGICITSFFLGVRWNANVKKPPAKIRQMN